MTIRAILDADLPAVVATWEAQRAKVGNLTPNLRYAPWTEAAAAAFLSMATVARMDDVTGSFCCLTFDPASGEYETVPGIKVTNLTAFGQCFHACAAVLPPPTSRIIRGSSPANAPAAILSWLTARFPGPVIANGVITWRATVAQVLAAAA